MQKLLPVSRLVVGILVLLTIEWGAPQATSAGTPTAALENEALIGTLLECSGVYEFLSEHNERLGDMWVAGQYRDLSEGAQVCAQTMHEKKISYEISIRSLTAGEAAEFRARTQEDYRSHVSSKRAMGLVDIRTAYYKRDAKKAEALLKKCSIEKLDSVLDRCVSELESELDAAGIAVPDDMFDDAVYLESAMMSAFVKTSVSRLFRLIAQIARLTGEANLEGISVADRETVVRELSVVARCTYPAVMYLPKRYARLLRDSFAKSGSWDAAEKVWVQAMQDDIRGGAIDKQVIDTYWAKSEELANKCMQAHKESWDTVVDTLTKYGTLSSRQPGK